MSYAPKMLQLKKALYGYRFGQRFSFKDNFKRSSDGEGRGNWRNSETHDLYDLLQGKWESYPYISR